MKNMGRHSMRGGGWSQPRFDFLIEVVNCAQHFDVVGVWDESAHYCASRLLELSKSCRGPASFKKGAMRYRVSDSLLAPYIPVQIYLPYDALLSCNPE